MTTIQVHPARSDAIGYWRTRFMGVARALGAELHEDAALFTCSTQVEARESIARVLRAARLVAMEYNAGMSTVFIPGKPALLVDRAARWLALCSVAANGRLATIDDVAVWGED